jgi:hypothetical protein
MADRENPMVLDELWRNRRDALGYGTDEGDAYCHVCNEEIHYWQSKVSDSDGYRHEWCGGGK